MPPAEIEITVPPGKLRERIDVYLMHHIENATRSKVQQAIRDGFVLIDGKTVKPSYKVSPGELIHITLPKSPAPDAVAEDIPLDIVYEDAFLLVVNKPAGMVTHPAYANYSGTLVNALLHYSKGSLSQLNDPTTARAPFPRPGIVHRLDKDTSGLMVIAKDDMTHAHLAGQFARRDINRAYWAIVWGLFSSGARNRRSSRKALSGVIDAPLGRSKSDRKKIAVTEGGKAAVTDYRVLEEFDYLSLVECRLRTGRTHQIRVHMHHIGHPVFGDPTYGGRSIVWGSGGQHQKDTVRRLLDIIDRQALHAKTIGFLHPATGERMLFDSDPPPDMMEGLALLRKDRPSSSGD